MKTVKLLQIVYKKTSKN